MKTTVHLLFLGLYPLAFTLYPSLLILTPDFRRRPCWRSSKIAEHEMRRQEEKFCVEAPDGNSGFSDHEIWFMTAWVLVSF